MVKSNIPNLESMVNNFIDLYQKNELRNEMPKYYGSSELELYEKEEKMAS